jgi:hypothetical protein
VKIQGQCHCGNLSYELDTQRSAAEIEARACDCSFCRIHAARNWSDPHGSAIIEVRDPQKLQRYVFALATADFYICQVCGGYLGAVLSAEDGVWSTVNLRLSDLPGICEARVSYGAESEDARVARRKKVWTPTRLIGVM